MLNRIVHFSLKFRGVVVTLACVLVGYGIFVAAHSKLDVLPNFVPPEVVVETEAPGLSPEQVEVLVTKPLEGTDIFIARQMLAEKLGEVAGELPTGVKAPTMSPLTSATMDLLKIGLVAT